jgi:hypothetical protein
MNSSQHYPNSVLFPYESDLICYCRSQISKLCHISRGSMSCLHVMILPCSLVTRHRRILRFICVYLKSNLRTSVTHSIYGKYITSQHVYIVSIDQKPACPTWFPWTFLMAYSKAKLKSSGDKASPCFRPFWIGKL